ncbi:hypothetical protein PSU4_23360 [Pseudonocardia sulfidoxydans NBRC 16205]|uniref:4Fe-4S Wbl-type domain-containing protein n=1 Tax=Pseudonocardia sulfidoxydans NBRC 16205 TaxID=1223511 RepID=A0A511DF31_9PSEU|nr:WhiB family transcriptional regulator [Pseudonocardia sulfidoxydans]GEL23382.1 hypothetical protein PSU4_23360 [Pseudonocardia sulfidoxydans NBRC 16205]
MTAARNEVRNWRAEALCVQVDPDLFFPETYRGTEFDRQVFAAKRVCAGCPVRTQCLDYALRALPDGIAGGKTPVERTALRHQLGVELVDVRVGLLPPDGQRERAAAGRCAAAAGVCASELMRRFGVARETAQRWRTDAHRTSQTPTCTTGVGEGSPAATGAPLRLSTARQALAGNTAPEGHEP